MRNPVFGYYLVNDLQTPPPKKELFGKIFLAYVSDDFKTKTWEVKINTRF